MRCYCINLDRRSDRWALTREILAEQGLRVTRFPAIDNGWKGCRDSHLEVMYAGVYEVAFLVFEDDIEFLHDISYLTECIRQAPKEWDAIFLGASPQEPQERYSDNLFRLKNAKCAHAILWHPRIGGAVDYILEHREEINKIDDYFSGVIFPTFNCFLTYPMICTQRQSQSDTCKRSDVSTILTNYTKYCK